VLTRIIWLQAETSGELLWTRWWTFGFYRVLKSHAIRIKIFIDGCSSIKFDWINKHTISPWLYKRPLRSLHVVTCSRQSVSCLETAEVQGCLFHKCNECSMLNTPGISFLLKFPEWGLGIHSRFSRAKQIDNISTQELFTGLHQRCRKEWMHRWTRCTFPTLHITLFLFSDFNVVYCLTNRTCVRNGLRDFSITLYKRLQISWLAERLLASQEGLCSTAS
jgi:hypothetical protein